MNCPKNVAAILLVILHHGILRTRAAGWSGDADRCAIEADHIHNLPHLLQTFSLDRLMYSWDAERACYLKSLGDGAATFTYWWEQLGACVEQLKEQAES